MSSTLIVVGHTNLSHDSVANKAVVEALERLLPGAAVDRLSDLYPSYVIDVKTEQEKLIDADTIVLQYPLFWYAHPSLLQKWLEDVWVHGFSHGSTGTALHGKELIASVTVGAPEEYYTGTEATTIEDLTKPIKAACALAGVNYKGTVTTYGVSYTLRTDEAAIETIIESAGAHAQRVADLVNG